MQYDFQAIEQKWQQHWDAQKTFHAPNPDEPGFDPDRPKFYVLDMFPYPSGAGLHVGHPLGYIATDIVARYRRMQGYNVLHPIGYDAFGLPAEQYAIDTGVHPRETTDQNIANMTRQLKRLGLAYDWDRCLATTDPGYYKWTQWIFLQLYNSWFDPAANAARPMGELQQYLENEQYYLDMDSELVLPPGEDMAAIAGDPVGLWKWHELSLDEQNRLLDSYRLAYIDEVPVNWCPALGTVLANEEVTNEGLSERGNHPVYERPLKQWMLRITAYADRLLEDLHHVDWPEPIKLMQRNWIGQSTGAEVEFPVQWHGSDNDGESIAAFTTRPDTLFGATYMVMAPEHPLVNQVTTAPQLHAVTEYQKQAAQKTETDRAAEQKEKTGVFTGAYALNPVNNAQLPIYIADYVMMGYGTGAIMAVPAHDERDFAFAQQFELPITPVVLPSDDWLARHAPSDLTDAEPEALRKAYAQRAGEFADAYAGHGTTINSDNEAVSFNGLETEECKQAIIDWLEDRGFGQRSTQYKLRDWLFSRQRYWGEPFPILHGPNGEIAPLDESELPVELPEVEQFKPQPVEDPDADPVPPLANAPDAWKYVKRGGATFTRELNTMPQWAGSCWYYLRYLDPTNENRFTGQEAEPYWMGYGEAPAQAPSGGVDLYVGGAEHAVLHLLYARFWHKVLYDLGHVSTPEPFGRLYNQGYIQAYAYTDKRGVYVPALEVQEHDGKFYYQGEEVFQEFGKMGKSLKNAITPDYVCDQYGCDTLRLYEMYMGPLDQSKVWNTRDIIGVHRFLQRVWRNFVNEDTGEVEVAETAPSKDLAKHTHKTIKRVNDSMEAMSFNVAIAAMIELNNELVQMEKVPRWVGETLVTLLAPMAPHICEELWAKLGYQPSVADAAWPTYDQDMLVEESVEYPVQINGKLRSKITVAADADNQAIQDAACADEKVQEALDDATIQKIIVVPNKMVNIVAK
jgi:leucyl-tRNA synthetase